MTISSNGGPSRATPRWRASGVGFSAIRTRPGKMPSSIEPLRPKPTRLAASKSGTSRVQIGGVAAGRGSSAAHRRSRAKGDAPWRAPDQYFLDDLQAGRVDDTDIVGGPICRVETLSIR